MMATTLVVTNDFPPRVGGIESFVADICTLLDDDVVVLSSRFPGAVAHDRGLPYPIVRTASVLLPTPTITRVAVNLLRSSGATRVVFGAAAPLSLMAGALRRAGAQRLLGLSHGHETWWATVPGARSLLSRMADDLDHLATISDYAAGRIAPALSSGARQRMIRLAPPVEASLFRPGPGGGDRRRCIAVGRFVAQKGFQTLLRAWIRVLGRWPAGETRPELVLVGAGPRRSRLQSIVAESRMQDSVRFTGPLPRTAVAEQLRASDVFALPVRTRLGGLNPEGLGLGFLEAAACGLPVLVGDSGGAPETVLHGSSGYVVASKDERSLASRLTELLLDRDRARRMGQVGRDYVTARYGTVQARHALHRALHL